MMDSAGSRAAQKRKLPDGGPLDPRDITLTIHGPEGVMDTPIENIKVRRNRTWIECFYKANLQITQSIKENYVIRPKSDDQDKYAQSFNSEVGKLADTLGSNKQFLEVVICKKLLPNKDKRTAADPTSIGESRRRSLRDSPKEAPSTSVTTSTDTPSRAVPETSKRNEPRAPAYEAKEKIRTWFQSFPKDKSNREESKRKRSYSTNLDQLKDLANELELPLEIVEHRVPREGPSRRGDVTSKWCVKIGEKVFTQEIGSDYRAARVKVIKTALGETRKAKHMLSFAKILQTDSKSSSEGDKNSVSLLMEIAKRQGLATNFEILKAEGSQHPTFTGTVTVGYLFEGSGASKKAAKTAAAKAALVACGVQKPTTTPTGGGNVEESLPKSWQTATAMMTGKGYDDISRSAVTPNKGKSPALPASNRENIDTLKVVSKLRGMSVTYTDFTTKNGYLCIASIDKPPIATHGYNHNHCLEAARNMAAGKMIHTLARTKD